jgi:hypothetical protein
MTGIVVIIFVAFFVYGFWRAVDRPLPPKDKPTCTVCGSSKRTLEWVRSWADWYCLPCKEECIHAILDNLTGELA